MVEQRAHERYPLLLRVDMSSDGKGRMYKVHTLDISISGCYIVSEHAPAPEDKVTLFLQYPKFMKGRKVEGLIRHVDMDGENCKGFGVEWVNSPENNESLAELREMLPEANRQPGDITKPPTEFQQAPEPAPQAPPAASEVPVSTTPAAGTDETEVRDMRLLIVCGDDQIAGQIRRASEMLSERHGSFVCRYDFCMDGDDAITMMEKARFDVVLIDSQITGLSCSRILLWMNYDPDTAKVPAAVIVDLENEPVRPLMEAGADFFVEKPVRLNELLLTLEAMLAEE